MNTLQYSWQFFHSFNIWKWWLAFVLYIHETRYANSTEKFIILKFKILFIAFDVKPGKMCNLLNNKDVIKNEEKNGLLCQRSGYIGMFINPESEFNLGLSFCNMILSNLYFLGKCLCLSYKRGSKYYWSRIYVSKFTLLICWWEGVGETISHWKL